MKKEPLPIKLGGKKDLTPVYWQSLLGDYAEEIIAQAHLDIPMVFSMEKYDKRRKESAEEV